MRQPRASRSVLVQAEGWVIDQWRRAVDAGDRARAAEWSQFLWSVNRSLVGRAARRLRALPLEEAHQIAALALYRALERFDTSRGVPFAAYAFYWFRKEGQAGQASARFAVALPPHRLSALTRGESTADAAIRALAVTVPLEQAESQPLETEMSPEDRVVDSLAAAALRDEVTRLAPLTREIVALRFGFDDGEPKSNRAVAKMLDVSEFTVRAHLARAIRTLRTRTASLNES